MPQYRKKPVVVEAFQMTKERTDSNSEWPQWLHDAWAKHSFEPGALYLHALSLSDRRLRLNTPEGPQTVIWNDWIIKGVNGELYLCKPDTFASTYDAVEPCSEPKVKLPHMHFMAVSGHAPDRCYTIAESMDPVQTGSHVLPLNANGEYYDAYAVDVQNHTAGHATETVTLTKRIHGDEIQFAMTVAGQEVVFVPQPACPQLCYMGDESDDDFTFTLSEVTPLVDDSLDVLLEKTGYVIVGRQRK